MRIKFKILILILVVFAVSLIKYYPVLAFSVLSVTGQSSNVTQTSATLYGNFGGADAEGATVAGFEYGPSSPYGFSTSEAVDFIKGSFVGDDSTLGFFWTGVLDTDVNDNIYVGGYTGFADEIQKFDSDGNYILTFGQNGSGLGEFNSISSLNISPTTNKIFVTDSGRRIQDFDLDGTNPHLFHQFLDEEDGGSIYRETPVDVAFDSEGNVYVSTLIEVGAGGIVTDISVGVFKYESNGDLIADDFIIIDEGDNRAQHAFLAIDSSDNVYLSVLETNEIIKYDSSGVEITRVTASGTGDGEFNSPVFLDIDSYGDLIIVDYGNSRLQKFDEDLNFIYAFDWAGQNDPVDVAVNSIGDIVVSVTDDSTTRVDILNGDFSSNISSLSCETAYFYRAYATVGDETFYGDDNTFTTDDCDEPAPSGGGGGGSSSGSRLPYVRITDNLSETKTSDVSLDVFTPEAVEGFSLSNTPDFKLKIDYANVQRGVKKINWNLCYGIEICNAGQKIIYAKFIHPSDSYLGEYDDATILYNPDLPKIVCPYFIGFAKKGWNNNREEVRKIQTFLNQNTNAEIVEDGIFGIKTEKAVKDFQQKYFMQIIAPWIDVTGLQKPSGWWFKTTAAWANSLLGCPTVVSDFSI